jgi:hypothetical protein
MEKPIPLNAHRPVEYRTEETQLGLLVSCNQRTYRIRGISVHSFEKLRVNIKAAQGEAFHIDSLDLYQSKARKSFAGKLAKLFSVDPSVIEADLLYIITEIEVYQAKKLAENKRPEKPKTVPMSKEEEKEALAFLKRADLMEQIIADLKTIGHVGEDSRKMLAYLIAVSRKLARPLSGIIISGSGAGKSGLVEKIQELTPPEDVEFYSRITPQALYYMDRDALKRKLLIIEERTGGEGADYSIRTLQSRQKLTTNANINHENATRCFEIYLDESIEQTRRIHAAQREAKTIQGIINRAKAEAIKKRHHNAQRLLKTVQVFNPYAPLLDFPADSLRTRRDHERFLSLIEAVTFLHQYQRPRREIITEAGEKIQCVESTVVDYAVAYRLASDILGFSLDDLKKHARDLLDLITDLVRKTSAETGKPEAEITFTRREIREFTGWPDYQIKTYIKQLEDLEYLLIEQIRKGGQFVYRLNHPHQRRPLKGLLTPEELAAILAKKNRGGRGGRGGLSTT